MTVTAYILAYNSEGRIAEAVRSVQWADEVLVIDSHSEDRTAEIAAELGARVEQVPFEGFGDLRNRSIALCTGDWIFSLDSDEVCTPEARDEIARIVADPNSVDVYLVPRRNTFFGRTIRHSGWYPNYRQPQLFRNGKMSYSLDPVHEGYRLHTEKPLGKLRSAIRQHPFDDLDEFVAKWNRYSTLGVDKVVAKGLGPSFARAVGRGFWAFIKHYVFKLGFLDGSAGFLIALGYFEVTFYRYAKHVERMAAEAPRA